MFGNNDIKLTVSTPENTREKAAHAFGFDQPSALDAVNRANFSSEEAYLDAAVKYELDRSDPTYQNTRRRLAAELDERREHKEREAQAAAYNEIRSGVKLNDFEQRQIDTQAAEMAHNDLAVGKIVASELGATISLHAEELTKKHLDTKASNILFNDILRGTR